MIIYWHIFHSSGFHHICNIKCRLDCRYSPQNILNAKNFNPHKNPISLLNVPICTQGMQRTWWPEAGTIIVTGPYYHTFHRGTYASPGVVEFKEYRYILVTTNAACSKTRRRIYWQTNWTIIGSDNGLSSSHYLNQRWHMSSGLLRKNFDENWIKVQQYPFKAFENTCKISAIFLCHVLPGM